MPLAKKDILNKIYLIQHCQSEHHINEMTGGWTDTPLTPLGREQAKLIGNRMKNEIESEDFIMYSSDLQRAWQTAEIIGDIIGLSPMSDPGLREINTGIAAGKTKTWANKHKNPRIPEEEFLDHHEFQGAESRKEFFLRVFNCMENIVSNNKNGKNLVIVCHGGSADYITEWWMGYDINMLRKSYFWGSPGSIHILESYQDRHLLTKFNDTSHFL